MDNQSSELQLEWLLIRHQGSELVILRLQPLKDPGEWWTLLKRSTWPGSGRQADRFIYFCIVHPQQSRLPPCVLQSVSHRPLVSRFLLELLQDWEGDGTYTYILQRQRNTLDWVIIFYLPWHAAIQKTRYVSEATAKQSAPQAAAANEQREARKGRKSPNNTC